MPRQQQLEQLHPHPLARQLGEPRARGDAGGKPRGVGQPVAIGGVEAEEAQDAQIILGDALCRVADEAHAARFEVGEAADIVVHDAVGAGRERIHGEVAPLGVRPPVAAEAHIGVAAEGLDVLAQRRHLERPAVDHHGDGAVLDAGRHRLEARRGRAPDHLVGHRGGGDVELADRLAEQRIAHRAADHARLFAVAVEHVEQPRQRALPQPRGVFQRSGRLAHRTTRPGTNLPSSTWAGS